jgi:hypothetical protein
VVYLPTLSVSKKIKELPVGHTKEFPEIKSQTLKFRDLRSKFDVAYTLSIGSSRSASHLHAVITDIYAFFTLWHQDLYPAVEEICVKYL